MAMSEHLIPYWMNKEFRKYYSPGTGKTVDDFIRKLREKRINQIKSKTFSEALEVRQILRRFPDTDIQDLQKKYPRVPVRVMKENLSEYTERRYISADP